MSDFLFQKGKHCQGLEVYIKDTDITFKVTSDTTAPPLNIKPWGLIPVHLSLTCPVHNSVATEPSGIFATHTGQKWVLQMRWG